MKKLIEELSKVLIEDKVSQLKELNCYDISIQDDYITFGYKDRWFCLWEDSIDIETKANWNDSYSYPLQDDMEELLNRMIKNHPFIGRHY